jgi:CheY-like chemotaxis protein
MEFESSRVLIVDDMSMNRMVLSSLLATQGIIADQAESGFECIDLCQQKDYDLILLDHRMPDMDGVDTLVKLKEIFESRGVNTPIVCHTTAEGRQNINLYKAAGFADVLIKPIEPNELFDVIVTYLSDKNTSEQPLEEIFVPDEELSPVEEDINNAEELDKLPMWLKLVPHIDLVAGIANCGSAEDYLDALYIFYSSIEEKAEEIRSFLNSSDWTMYALRVHSLKSMARLIGAKKLGDLAARLEDAARKDNHKSIRANTPELLESYTEFSSLLSKLKEEDFRMSSGQTSDASDEESGTGDVSYDFSHNVLFIQSGQGIIQKGIVKNLEEAGFNVVSIPDEPDRIIAHRKDFGIIIYHTSLSDNAHIGLTMNLLGEICHDDNKILCLTGEMSDLKTAMLTTGAYRVSKCYQRPVVIDEFIKDMTFYAALQIEYRRKKTIFVVDDDRSYLSIIMHWLSDEYNVSAFNHVKDALNGLSAVTPDLILLDYEMPEMNGFDLMRKIRASFPDITIPIIFLTGKNDKELVFQVLEDKPEGYLLKTSQKEVILDTIHRYFAETIFKASRKGLIEETESEH